MNNKTAILIFANSAEKETVSKPFHFSKDVFEMLNEQTLHVAKKTGLPYFLFSEKQQVGNSFGERFTNAIQSIYSKGFDAVITIGNDTPHLSAKHLTKTITQLQKHDLVLGPSTDGGFYLMGLKKSLFNVEAFLKLPWQTSALNRSISKLSALKKTNIYYLEVLTDIDVASDINTILNSFKSISTYIKQHLLQAVSTKKKIASHIYFFVENLTLKRAYNKGSPLLLHL